MGQEVIVIMPTITNPRQMKMIAKGVTSMGEEVIVIMPTITNPI